MPVQVGRGPPGGEDRLDLQPQLQLNLIQICLREELRLISGREEAAIAVEQRRNLLGRSHRVPAVGGEVAEESEMNPEWDIWPVLQQFECPASTWARRHDAARA